VIYTLASRLHGWIYYDQDRRPYAVPVPGRFHTNDDLAMRQAAFDGLGILRMPKLFVEDALDEGRLIQLWPDDAAPGVPLTAVGAGVRGFRRGNCRQRRARGAMERR
jgi:DNA-binding transcriptional LysR family regulator